jgi:ABC-type transporter Mla MlaB component
MAAEPPVFHIPGPLRREDLPALYTRACVQFSALRGDLIIIDVTGVAADAVSVDALARLQLAARRHGCRVILRGTGADLRDLIALMGLDQILVSPTEAEARTGGIAARSPGRT